MKRSNAIILGTILVFLVGIILFMQTGTDPFVNKARQEFQQQAREQGNLSGTVDPAGAARQSGAVTADDLVNEMGVAPGNTEDGTRGPGSGLMQVVPDRPEQLQPTQPAPGQNSSQPSSRWFDPNKRAGSG
jgi:hypothetical protein